MIKMICIVFIAACAFPINADAKGTTNELIVVGEIIEDDVGDGSQGVDTPVGTPGVSTPGTGTSGQGSTPKDTASSKRLPQLNENKRYANILLLLGIKCLLLFLVLVTSKRKEATP